MTDWTPWRAIEDGDGLWDVVDSRDDLVAFGMTEDAARRLVETPALVKALQMFENAYQTGRNEPLVIASEHARAVLARAKPLIARGYATGIRNE